MTDEENYLFDLQGYLVVEDALDAGALGALNGLIDQKISELDDPEFQAHRFVGVLGWGAAMFDLVAHARMVPVMQAVIGGGYRLDHDYLDVTRKGLSPIGATLHGGGTPHHPALFYDFRDGRMRNGLAVVAYNLCDVNPGEGGFGCVPGSHKANFPFPRDWTNMANTRSNCVRAVTGKAGTAVIFTEGLTHGALPWTSDAERRTLFYKYNHASMSWSNRYYDANDFEDLSDEQKKILAPPQEPSLVEAYIAGTKW